MTGEHRIGAFIDKTSSTVQYTYDEHTDDVYIWSMEQDLIPVVLVRMIRMESDAQKIIHWIPLHEWISYEIQRCLN